jgi:hypothetical protein
MIISRQLHSYFKMFSMIYRISMYLGHNRQNGVANCDRYPTKVDGIDHKLYMHSFFSSPGLSEYLHTKGINTLNR